MEPIDGYSQMVNQNPNILVKTPTFGTLDGVKYLDKLTANITYVYNHMINFFKKHMGYEKDFDMYGAPYDFRQVTSK